MITARNIALDVSYKQAYTTAVQYFGYLTLLQHNKLHHRNENACTEQPHL